MNRLFRSRISLPSAPVLALILPLFWSGCGYVHFGRLPANTGDSEVQRENSDLRLEKKLLQQELALVRKESGALRSALEAKDSGTPDTALVAKLAASTRELAALRASYAELQSQRQSAANSGSGASAVLQARFGATEEKLAQTLRDFTRLQQENDELKKAITRGREENARLGAQVEKLRGENSDIRAALAQLNTELLAQKEARAQAEQNAAAWRAQLRSVMQSANPPTKLSSLGDLREHSASGAREMDTAGLSMAGVLADGTLPTAILQTKPQGEAASRQGSSSAQTQAAAPAAAATGEKATQRRHKVTAGETLEILSQRYYGRPDRWRLIYIANHKLLRDDQPLRPGMELVIPPPEGSLP